MKRTLTFHTTISSDEGTLLLHLAIALRERRFTPEALTLLRAEGRGEVTVSLTIAAAHEQWLPALIERLQEIPGAHAFEVLAPPAGELAP